MNLITGFIYRYGILAMFFLILIEYACFPISSEIVLPFSGAVASIQNLPYLVILPLSVLAGMIGTSFCYVVGRLGGTKVLYKIMKRFPKTEKGIHSSLQKFERYGALAVCAGRVIPICRTYIAFVAGAAGQSYSAFFFSSVLGITVWNTLLIGLGYALGTNWEQVIHYYKEYKHIILIIIVCILASVIFGRLLRKRSPNGGTEEHTEGK